MAKHYKDVIAWPKAMHLVPGVCDPTQEFPEREIYSLTGQIRRAAVPIPSNIGEAQAQFSNRGLLHFPRQARDSPAELETRLLRAQRRNYLCDAAAWDPLKLADELNPILTGLINSFKKRG